MRHSVIETRPMLRPRGLRSRAAVWLIAFAILPLCLVAGLGFWQLDAVRHRYAAEYVRDHMALEQNKLFAMVSRQLALTRQFASADLTRRFAGGTLPPEDYPRFFADAEVLREYSLDQSYSVVSGHDGAYYYNGPAQPFSTKPRAFLSPQRAGDGWYYASLKSNKDYNLNVDFNVDLKETKLWINVLIRDQNGRPSGAAATGLPLSDFLSRFVNHNKHGISSIMIDRQGLIQAHRNPALIEYSTISNQSLTHTIDTLLGRPQDVVAVRAAMADLSAGRPAPVLDVILEGRRQLLAMGWVPELNWYTLSAIDLDVTDVFDTPQAWTALAVLLGLILTMFALVMLWMDRVILAPLQRLTTGARQLANGDYSAEVGLARQDEIGQLAHAFDQMACQVRTHTEQLETTVAERTRALEDANRDMAQAHRKISDSIRYASLIQNAILPTATSLERLLPQRHLLLWQPRDIVGGDFFIFREDARGYLLGIIDCAGHGVSGAFMTMLAHAAFKTAIEQQGLGNPAGLLSQLDEAARSQFVEQPDRHQVTTTMDAALCYVEPAARRLTFSSAKLALHVCVDGQVTVHKGGRRALGERRRGEFANLVLPLEAGQSFYLSSDGLLDQAGGDAGYSFGNSRLLTLLARLDSLPWPQRQQQFTAALADYQGSHPQRDDITVLGFAALPPAASPSTAEPQ